MTWPWLMERPHMAELRDTLRESEPYFSSTAIEAVKYIAAGQADDLIPGYRWKARCKLSEYAGGVQPGRRNLYTWSAPRGHAAPHIDCSCGFYAWTNIECAPNWYKRAQPWDRRDEDRAGMWRVELAGRVIEHERGYRAEKVRLVERIEPRDPVEVLHELGQGTTQAIRQAAGFWSSWDTPTVRYRLKKAARNGECTEVKTPVPNNHGGHLWISSRSAA